jgi:hypothetical protein
LSRSKIRITHLKHNEKCTIQSGSLGKMSFTLVQWPSHFDVLTNRLNSLVFEENYFVKPNKLLICLIKKKVKKFLIGKPTYSFGLMQKNFLSKWV